MNTALKVVLWLFVLVMVGFGLTIMLNPSAMVGRLAVDPQGAAGLSTLRAGHGAFLASIGVMIALGLRTKETLWFLASALLISLALVGRFTGLIVDGMSAGLGAKIGQEALMIALLITARFRLRA